MYVCMCACMYPCMHACKNVGCQHLNHLVLDLGDFCGI